MSSFLLLVPLLSTSLYSSLSSSLAELWADLRVYREKLTYSFVSSTDKSVVLSILQEEKDREDWETSFKALAQPFFQVRVCPPAAHRYHVPKAPLCWWSRPFPDTSAELRVFPRGRKEIGPLFFEQAPRPAVVSCSAPADSWLPGCFLYADSDPPWKPDGFLPLEKITCRFLPGQFCSCPFGGKFSPCPPLLQSPRCFSLH